MGDGGRGLDDSTVKTVQPTPHTRTNSKRLSRPAPIGSHATARAPHRPRAPRPRGRLLLPVDLSDRPSLRPGRTRRGSRRPDGRRRPAGPRDAADPRRAGNCHTTAQYLARVRRHGRPAHDILAGRGRSLSNAESRANDSSGAITQSGAEVSE